MRIKQILPKLHERNKEKKVGSERKKKGKEKNIGILFYLKRAQEPISPTRNLISSNVT